jgi:hypothetical protein
VQQDWAAEQFPRRGSDEAWRESPKGVEQVEWRSAMLRHNGGKSPERDRGRPSVMNGRSKEGVTVRARRTEYREDVDLMPPRQALDKPVQTGHAPMSGIARHTAQNHES